MSRAFGDGTSWVTFSAGVVSVGEGEGQLVVAKSKVLWRSAGAANHGDEGVISGQSGHVLTLLTRTNDGGLNLQGL